MIFSINSLEIRAFELKGLKLKYRIPTENYMEGIFSVGNNLYFGGEETELFSINYQQNINDI